jgi:hypothetical protein
MLRGVSACSEVMNNMRPLMPACRMRRPSSRAMRKPDRTLVLTIASQVASDTVSGPSASRRGGEAEWTNMASGWSWGGSAARHPSVVERSTVTASADPPAVVISCATSRLRSASMSTSRTAAPSRARATAMARPMLEAEPVTRAASPRNNPIEA